MRIKQYTFKDFKKLYPSDEKCLEEVFNRVYGEYTECPKCGKSFKCYKLKGLKLYSCQWCGHNIAPTASTIFHKSDTPLVSWFFAIYLFSVSKNGVAAKELERYLGVTYKTAWRMAFRIRLLLESDGDKLKNIVEADETYVGPSKEKNTRIKIGKQHTPVIGVVERSGEIRAEVAKDASMSTLSGFIRKNVSNKTRVITDEWASYRDLKHWGYAHDTINHSNKKYGKGDIYTNTIEGFWSQLKRSINGTYHAVSPKYLQVYVNEFSWRYNHRASLTPTFALLIQKVGKHVL